MIAHTHMNHFVLVLDSGECVVLDATAKEVARRSSVGESFSWIKEQQKPPSDPPALGQKRWKDKSRGIPASPQPEKPLDSTE